MRLREILMISALFFGGAGLVGCEQNKGKSKASASSPASTTANDTSGAAKKVEMPTDDKSKATAKADGKLPFEATGPVAVVDGHEITAERFNSEVERMVKVMQGRVPPQMLQFYKKQILFRLVDEHLLNKIVAEKKITLSEEELTKEFEELKKRFPTPDQYELFKQRMGVDDAALREDMRTQATHKKLFEEHYGVKVAEADIKDYYDKNIDRFKQEEQVKASHILFKVDKGADDAKVKEIEKKAADIAKKAKAKDADFAALAKEHSEGPSAPKGGDLGMFPRKRMVKPFSDAAFKLKPGEVSDPVRTTFGWHVIKVVERQDARTQPFDEVKDKVEEMLYTKKLRETMAKVMGDLKKEAKIEYKEDNIKMNVEAPKTPPMMPGMPGAHGGHGHGGHGHAHGDGHGHGAKPKIKVNPKVNPSVNPKIKLNDGAKLKLNTAPKGGAAPAPKQ